MKILSGAELADYIKERQAKQVRGLRQAWHVAPKLVIVRTSDDPVIDLYVRLKQRYGQDILVDVEVVRCSEDEAAKKIDELNQDDTVQGIIVQLPLGDVSRTDEVLSHIAPEKDVDALTVNSPYDAATPVAINWLLAGYNVDIVGKNIVVVGQGRLVGGPLTKMWRDSGLEVTAVDDTNGDISELLQAADIIVSATGVPGLITSDMLRPDTVVVDAGTATEGGKIVGDLAPEVRERHDLVLTPEKGGVGPLTVCALFDNVIRAARATAATEDLEQS